MSEALTPTPITATTTAPTPQASAASLYPADGGAAAAAAALAATQTAPAATDTVTGGAGADSLSAPAGTDTITAPAGTDTVAGGETTVGTGGADSISGAAGTDSISAESYNFTLPEGFTDDAVLTTEARSVLAAAGVAPDKAQPLIDLFGKAVKASADAQAAAFNTQQTTWLQEINAMPEFQGPTRETSLQAIGRLWDEYGTPEAKEALNGPSKLGNNPALTKFMLKIANALTEGSATPPGGVPPNRPGGRKAPTTVGQSLYPDA